MAGEPSMNTKLELFLFALQSTFGSGVGALANTDFADVEAGASLENDLQMDEISSAEGFFGQPQQIPGNMPANANLPYILRSKGDNDPGYWALPFQCGGMDQDVTTKVYTYDPTSLRTEWKDGTLWHYTGSQVSSGALLEKASNLMFDWEITLTPGKVGRIVFTGRGAHTGAPTAATQPSVTRNTQLATAILGSTVSIMGYAYKFTELKITGKINPEVTLDPSNTYGNGRTFPGDIKIGWTAKLYAVLPSETDAFTQLLAGTKAAFSVVWGAAPNKFTISSPNDKAQIISRKKSDQNNITTLDIAGIFVDNDFRIVVDTTT